MFSLNDFSSVTSFARMFNTASNNDILASFYKAAISYLQNTQSGSGNGPTGGTNFLQLEPGDILDTPVTAYSSHHPKNSGSHKNKPSVVTTSSNGNNNGVSGIDLSGFGALQLPTGSQGHPDTISGGQLKSYNGSAFKQGNGKITLSVPEGGGVTTKNSQFARSELREKGTWHMSSGPKTLSATLSVDKFPKNGDIVIGQIHQEVKSGAPRPPLELHIKRQKDGTAKIVASVMDGLNASGHSNRHDITIASGIKPGEKFSYSMQVNPDGKLNITAAGHSTQINFSQFQGHDLYFKAGNYTQDKSGGSAVSFYGLKIS